MRDDRIYLNHVLERIKHIEESTKGISLTAFRKDKDIQDATIRRIETIGEAIKNVSETTKNRNPNIEWKKIAGTRDILIHAYFSVDIDMVWDILEKDLPKLKKEIKKILDESKK
ncbi:MAG: DUF86 domain-containing protein [Nanoarchaeota archaeon]|nr:DUF86 domain-containing protein [Nanoarchaeota archaeon]